MPGKEKCVADVVFKKRAVTNWSLVPGYKECFKIIDEKIQRKVECKAGRKREMKNHTHTKRNSNLFDTLSRHPYFD